MKFHLFGNGDRLPMVGLGTWKAAPGEVYQAVRDAIRLGYRHIDCAPVYGNEREIGDALADAMSEGEVSRSDLWVTSKLWNDSHKKSDVEPALRKTLSDLKLESLDLYLIHWPVAFRKGVGFPHSRDDFLTLEEVPLQETWRALEECVEAGLSRHLGVSNFSVKKLEMIMAAGRMKPEVNQVELHPLLAQQKLLQFCQQHDVLLTAYSPLGSRDRDTAFRPKNEPDLLTLEPVKNIAARRQISPAQVLLAWALNRSTAVIPKSVRQDHLAQNLQAVEIELSGEEMTRLNAQDKRYRFISGAFFAGKNSPYTVGGIWDE